MRPCGSDAICSDLTSTQKAGGVPPEVAAWEVVRAAGKGAVSEAVPTFVQVAAHPRPLAWPFALKACMSSVPDGAVLDRRPLLSA
jgi:hypothetical protein